MANPYVRSVGVVAAGVVLAALGVRRLLRKRAVNKGIEVRRTVTVQASAPEIYDLWRTFTDEWGVELVEETPGRRLRWRVPHGPDRHEGTLDLREAVGDRGTIVDVRLRFHPRGGLLVAGVTAGVLRKTKGLRLANELARMRMWLETGELAQGAS